MDRTTSVGREAGGGLEQDADVFADMNQDGFPGNAENGDSGWGKMDGLMDGWRFRGELNKRLERAAEATTQPQKQSGFSMPSQWIIKTLSKGGRGGGKRAILSFTCLQPLFCSFVETHLGGCGNAGILGPTTSQPPW